jgi:hypothetical protein
MAEARLFYESDCNLDVLSGKTVAIVHRATHMHLTFMKAVLM